MLLVSRDDLPADERLPGTLAATAISAWHGARVFRTHDPRETRQVLDLILRVEELVLGYVAQEQPEAVEISGRRSSWRPHGRLLR